MTDLYTRWILRGTDDTKSATRSATRNLKDIDKTVQAVQRGFAALAGGAALTGFVANIARAGEQVEAFERGLTAATGSAAQAVDEFKFISNEADRLGLNLESAAGQFVKLTAAAKGTRLEGAQTREIFTSIATASRVLNLSADQTAGALTAIEQIISKGTVSTEELRQQLGERIPGAFGLAARAIGVTETELNKLLQTGSITATKLLPQLARELNKVYGPQSADASRSLTGEINKLSNSMLRLKTSIAESGLLSAVSALVRGLTAGVDAAGEFGSKLKEISLGDKAKTEIQLLETELARLSRLIGIRQSVIDSGRVGRVTGGTREATQEDRDKQRADIRALLAEYNALEQKLANLKFLSEPLEFIDINAIRAQRQFIEGEFTGIYDRLTAQSKTAYESAKASIEAASASLDEFIQKEREAADAATAIFEATRTPIEQFISKVSEARELLNKELITQDTFDRYKKQLLDTLDIVEDIPERTKKSVDKFGRYFERGLAQYITRPTDDAFSGMVRSFENALAQMAAELISSQLVKLLKSLFSGGSGSGGSNNFLSSLAGIFSKAFLPGGPTTAPGVSPAPPTNAPVAQTFEIVPPAGIPLEIQAADVQSNSSGQFTQLVLGVVGADIQQNGGLAKGLEQRYGLAPTLGAR